MLYIKFTCQNNYCGCNEEFFEAFEDGTSEYEIENYGYEILTNDYGFYYPDSRFIGYEEEYESEEEYCAEYDLYQAECSVDYCEITEEEYRENVMGGW